MSLVSLLKFLGDLVIVLIIVGWVPALLIAGVVFVRRRFPPKLRPQPPTAPATPRARPTALDWTAGPMAPGPLVRSIAFVLMGAIACSGSEVAPSRPESRSLEASASPAGDVARSSFPSGPEAANACLPDRTMSLLLIPDMPYTSMARPQPWWDSVPHESRQVLGGRATEYVAKDPNDGRVTTEFWIRAVRWWVSGRANDPRYRSAVECAYQRLEQR